MRYCEKCGLPESYPGIILNNSGSCNYCEFYQEHREKLEDAEYRHKIFREQVEEAKKKAAESKAPYDCVIGFSGGKDSSYIVWQMKKVYGMRVLAVTFQNGFHTEYGRDNIENILQKLDVDHITVRLNEQTLRSYYSKCMSLMKNFCSVCFHFGNYYCHMMAGKYKIPLIINGRTKGQILQNALDTKGIEPFDISRNLKDFEYQMFGKLVEKSAERKCMDYLEDVEVTSLSYFAYHDITEEETMAFLEKEIGWKRPDTGLPHADCWAHAMAENLSIEKRGYPVRTGELAVLVRRGELTKEEASAVLEEDRKRYSEIDPKLRAHFNKRISPLKIKRA
ncbi:MAG: 7-cyano-7-deazaguanine synthase [Eubacteriales bacterium]|nr:7-cyano-7-deazaguanine synthase [Eubacteriales bacterium]